MRRLRVFSLLFVLCTSYFVLSSCSSGPPPPTDNRPYADKIQAFRADKDRDFRMAKDSPIPVAERAAFRGLSYYAIDADFHVPAFLTEDHTGPPVIIELPTTAGDRQRMRRVGTLGFSIHGVRYTLSAFNEDDARTMDRLFVPFGDLTNGAGTYRGGRYINLERTSTGIYDLDFNRAYHPFCVYNHEYDCPIPPKENRLTVAIAAGERLPQ